MIVEIENLDIAFEHKKEVHRPLATLKDKRALRQAFDFAVTHDAPRHVFAEPPEYLRLARVGVGGIEIRNGRFDYGRHGC